jgi:pSer/pThr/pTyr-binding forkhead associated (FHA) protein
MPKLILKFEDRVLKECALGLMESIGRLPDNTIVIDNPAVSGHHACVFREGDSYIVEDLGSTNGTFVGDRRVTRQALRHGDVLVVGKHALMFDAVAAGQRSDAHESKPAIAGLSDTVFLDTERHKALLSKLTDAQAGAAAKANGTAVATAPASAARVGVLRVISGQSDASEYELEGQTSLIGKSDSNLVRLKGWFKPKVSVAITRNGQSYVATRLAGSTLLNSEPLNTRTTLKEGDILAVDGLTLEFRLKDRR